MRSRNDARVARRVAGGEAQRCADEGGGGEIGKESERAMTEGGRNWR